MNIIKSLILALLFSFFIYLQYFDIVSYLANTIVVIAVFYTIFTYNKKELFWSGFFIGVLWFYWIGYSFVYYDLVYLVPIIILAIAFIYGSLFYLIGLFDSILYRVCVIFLLSFLEPFGFNWFKFELLFINSYIGITKIEFLLFLFFIGSLVYFISSKKRLYFLIFFIGLSSLIYYNSINIVDIKQPNIKIYLAQTNIDQDKKWNRKYTSSIIEYNFNIIDKAIKNKFDLVVLPETTLPLVLNNNIRLLDILKEKSYHIDIIIGSLEYKNNNYYNSTYYFSKGIVQTAQKVVLVPFGEEVPLPKVITKWINDTFYNGAKDYSVALKPTTFSIKNIKFRNAICYEATTDTIYQNLDTPYIIAISNNAWFTPSIEPTLQYLLLKYYAKKYHTMIFSVTNKDKTTIIKSRQD